MIIDLKPKRVYVTDSPIERIELIAVAVPPRRPHRAAGQTETIGRWLLVKMTDAVGQTGWGEATVLKDWSGEFGRYYGESRGTVACVIQDYLAPAVKGCLPGQSSSCTSAWIG